MKKILLKVMTFVLAITVLSATVHAEPGYEDTSYWTTKCAKAQVNANDYNACSAFRTYMANKSSDLNSKLSDISSQRTEIAKNISKYQSVIDNYAKQNAELQAQMKVISDKISGIQTQIQGIQNNIDVLLVQIDEKQQKIEVIKTKLKKRMEEKQPTMRTNTMVELILGAKSFDEILRILSGLDSIAKSDQKARDEYLAMIEELNAQKADLDTQKADMETAKAELDTQKGELSKQSEKVLALKYQAQIVQDEYEKQSAQLEAQGNKIASDIAAVRQTMANITVRLEQVPETNPHSNPGTVTPPTTSSGWVRPVSGAYRSAGTWYYPSGGVHLGYDFAAAVGTPVVAVGNGVILKSADGCPTIGGLGSGCGYQNGGSSGGGNQVYLLTKINGNLYAVKYLHLMQGSPIATGTIVMAGQQIGKLGSSGNSSGPHCHIEIFFLGSANNFATYAQTWNGDMAFGAGWGQAGISRNCDNRGSAPCRIRPESIFGN